MEKYIFQTESIENALITLLSVVNAIKINHTILKSHESDGTILPIFIIENQIIQEKLIYSAIKIRMIDDQYWTNKSNRIYDKRVGDLIIESKTLELDLREACNKIIHADKIKFYKDFNNHKNIIEYAGKDQKNNDWVANINISEYCINGLALLKQYDENWDISSK